MEVDILEHADPSTGINCKTKHGAIRSKVNAIPADTDPLLKVSGKQ